MPDPAPERPDIKRQLRYFILSCTFVCVAGFYLHLPARALIGGCLLALLLTFAPYIRNRG